MKNKIENMDIEYWETSKLIPYARNAKLHDAQQISQIAGSIKEFGFNDPVEISSDGVIIAGHGRVLAAQLLDIKEVPVIIHSHLSEPQRRAYTLLNNRLADIGGGWDNELLNLELDDLKIGEFDLSCFDEISFDDGFDEPTGTPSLDDLEKEYGEPKDDDFYPIIKVQATPDGKKRFEQLMEQASGNNEYEKFDVLLDAVDVNLDGCEDKGLPDYLQNEREVGRVG